MSDNNNQVLSDVDSQAGDSEFEGNVVMPTVVNSSNDGSTDTDTSSGSSLVSSDYSTEEEEKVPEPPVITGVGRSTQTTAPFCGVCYKDLTIENNVTTNCNHHFCNTCFFRWIEVNATCPQCRAPIDSNTNLTDDQLSKEMSDLYQGFQHYLIENQRLYREQHRLCEDILGQKDKMYKLKMTTNSLLKRQIRLREQIEETRGYNQGQIAALHNFKNNNNKEEFTSRVLETMLNNQSFMHGFHSAIHKEEKLLKSFKKNVLTKLHEENMKIHHPDCYRDISFIADDEQED